MFEKAKAFRDANTFRAESYDQLKQIINDKRGFVRCYFKQDKVVEAKIKEEIKATVRCIPLDQPGKPGKCIYSGETVDTEVLFAQSY